MFIVLSLVFVADTKLIYGNNFVAYLTYFQPMSHFYAPMFSMFSGGIEVEHWLKTG